MVTSIRAVNRGRRNHHIKIYLIARRGVENPEVLPGARDEDDTTKRTRSGKSGRRGI